MWPQGIMLAAGSVLGTAAMLGAMQGARAAMALGLAGVRATQREGLRAGFEAMECVEDLVAEARAGRLEALPVAPVEVVAGRVAAGGAAAAPAPVRVTVEHAGPGRLRLRPQPLSDAAALELAEGLARFPGVRRAGLRPLTGSVVLDVEGDGGALAASLELAGVLRRSALHFRHPAALGALVALDRLDALVRMRSAGREDLRGLLGATLEALEARARGGPR